MTLAVCRHCGKPISLLRKLRGQVDFCSEEHHREFQAETEQLAIAALSESHDLAVHRVQGPVIPELHGVLAIPFVPFPADGPPLRSSPVSVLLGGLNSESRTGSLPKTTISIVSVLVPPPPAPAAPRTQPHTSILSLNLNAPPARPLAREAKSNAASSFVPTPGLSAIKPPAPAVVEASPDLRPPMALPAGAAIPPAKAGVAPYRRRRLTPLGILLRVFTSPLLPRPAGRHLAPRFLLGAAGACPLESPDLLAPPPRIRLWARMFRALVLPTYPKLDFDLDCGLPAAGTAALPAWESTAGEACLLTASTSAVAASGLSPAFPLFSAARSGFAPALVGAETVPLPSPIGGETSRLDFLPVVAGESNRSELWMLADLTVDAFQSLDAPHKAPHLRPFTAFILMDFTARSSTSLLPVADRSRQLFTPRIKARPLRPVLCFGPKPDPPGATPAVAGRGRSRV